MENLEKVAADLGAGEVVIDITSPGQGVPAAFSSVEELQAWAADHPGREIMSLVYVCRDESGECKYVQLPSGAIVDDNGDYVVIRVMFGQDPLNVLLDVVTPRDAARKAREAAKAAKAAALAGEQTTPSGS